MRESEFYSKAQEDPVFRADQIEALRYRKKLGSIVGLGGVGCWLAYVAYCRLVEARWPSVDVTFLVVICAVLYSQAHAKCSALRAMDAIARKPNQPPQRNAGSRPSSDDSSVSETPSSLGPRG